MQTICSALIQKTRKRLAGPAKRAEIYKSLDARLRELAPTLYLYDLTGVFTVRDVVTVPALSDRSKRYFDNFNLVFREMSIGG